MLVLEAIAMWWMRLLGRLRRWYHSNDEIYLSDECHRQRAQARLDYYAHVGDPTCG
jgi:hypothetical protein